MKWDAGMIGADHTMGPIRPMPEREIEPTINRISDDILISDSPYGKSMSIPLSSEEARIMSNLPRPAQDEFRKNVHEYIGQLGKEHGNPPPQGRP